MWYFRLTAAETNKLAKHGKDSGLQISWTTITYRSVLLATLAIVLVLSFVSYLLFPQQMKNLATPVLNAAANLFAKVGLGDAQSGRSGGIGPQQAHFTAIEGAVRVKKASGNTWINADYNLPLDRGDVVQTTSEGMAKIVLADGTSYTIKQDSLIVIDDNTVNADQQTQVSVQVTTGTVDLATATFSQGSRSQVVVAGATAALAPESAAQVRNDPRADEHEILVTRGSGEVSRRGEVMRLTEYEKVSFKAESPRMAKTKELGPPTLIGPPNMAPIFTSGSSTSVQFSWTPVVKAAGYRIRVSHNPYFSSLVLDSKTSTSEMTTQLPEGVYYWTVQSLDGAGASSIESEKNRFTVIPKAQEKIKLALELQGLVQHGHVIEIRGRTEPGAKVMVNGQEVPIIASDGTFQFLTPPLPTGESVLTITAQNARGGVNTQQKKVVIQ